MIVGRGGQAADRTFLFFLLDVAFTELFPPRRQIPLRRRIDGRHRGGLGIPVAHSGGRKGAMVAMHAAGHGERRRRAGGLSSGRCDGYVQGQGVAGASRDQKQLLGQTWWAASERTRLRAAGRGAAQGSYSVQAVRGSVGVA